MKNILLAPIIFVAIVILASSTTTRYTTPWNDAGGGDVIFLDRHNVKCPQGQALASFHLMRHSDGQIGYEYQCESNVTVNSSQCTSKTNAPSGLGADRKESVNFLDRQDVKCAAGNVLTQFQLKTPPDQWHIQYQYTCCAAILANCSTKYTSIQDLGVGNLIYLDRQYVNVPSGDVITGFKLQAQYPNGGKTGNYRVDYCTPMQNQPTEPTQPDEPVPQETSYVNGWGAVFDGDLYVLRTQNMACKKGEAIINFQVEINDDSLRYRYDCKPVPSMIPSGCVIKNVFADFESYESMSSLDALTDLSFNCPSGTVLTQFLFRPIYRPDQLYRAGYKYTCCPAAVTQCSETQTPLQQFENDHVSELTKHNVTADVDSVMTGFVFNTEWMNDVRLANYQMRSCATDPTQSTQPTPPTDEPDLPEGTYVTSWDNLSYGSIGTLGAHYVVCKEGQAITNFELERLEDKIRYKYHCKAVPGMISRGCDRDSDLEDYGLDDEKSIIALRHVAVTCPSGTVLTQFSYVAYDEGRPDHGGMYDRTCCPATVNQCSETETPLQEFEDDSVLELVNHNVTANADSVMTGFVFDPKWTDDGSFYNYLVRSCVV